MRKILFATGAALAIASVALAAGYAFNSNLTVGSTGPDVVALQTALISAGNDIPAISSGAAAKGYFGSQTKAAVKLYQAAHGIPNTGFVGPLTRAALNGGAVVTTTTTVNCPAGYTCIANNTTTTGAPAGITTPGVAGTLAVSLWSTPSGVTVYKGQAYDVGAYKLQAAASDMAVTNFALDFSDRLWLYANSITIRDETGAVVGSVSNLNASNFSELTVGSDYRIAVPVNLVVKATQSKYLTVNIVFNAISDRSSGTLYITQAQVRAVDGTGVNDTETVSSSRSFSYNGSTTGQIFVSTNSSPVPTQLVQISTSVQTQNVLLANFNVKSANEGSTLQNLNLTIRTAKASISALFNNIQIKVNDLTYSASSIGSQTNGSSTVAFTNLQVPLRADEWTPVSVYVTVAADSASTLEGATASTTLVANTTNLGVVDATYNNLTVNSATLNSNEQTFSSTGVSVPTASTGYGTLSCSQTLVTCNQTFSFTYSLTAGNNAIYVPSNVYTAIATSSDSTSLTITSQNFSDSDTNGDGTGYFYIAPGFSKTFTALYKATGNSTTQGGTLQVGALYYGTAAGTYTSPLSSSALTNALKAVLFH